MKLPKLALFHFLPSFLQNAFLRLIKSTWRLGPFYTGYLILGCPEIILAGPCRGIFMKFPDSCRSGFRNFLQKFVGTYEMEISDLLARWQKMEWDTILDVGAAEGYYALHFARDFRANEVQAYDLDNFARWMLRQNAQRNGLADRLKIESLCSWETIQEVGKNGSKTLLFVDIEGSEWELLDPEKAPNLIEMHILVEVHEQERPGIGKELRRRFAWSHLIEEFFSRPRVLNDFPSDIMASDEWKLSLMDELRPGQMSWLALTPKR